MKPSDLGLSQAPGTREAYVLHVQQQRATAKAFLCLIVIALLLTSCMALVDVERPGGVRYSAAVAVGTDAAEISRPGSWKATGVNNSTAAGALKSGVITREGLRLAAPAVSRLGGSIGKTLENVSQ